MTSTITLLEKKLLDNQSVLRKKEETINILRDENAKLKSDLDKAMLKQKEDSDKFHQNENDLRQQVSYYQAKCCEPSTSNNQLQLENMKLKAELESFKCVRSSYGVLPLANSGTTL